MAAKRKPEPEPKRRGRPPLHGQPPKGAYRISIYCTAEEYKRVLDFLRSLREEKGGKR